MLLTKSQGSFLRWLENHNPNLHAAFIKKLRELHAKRTLERGFFVRGKNVNVAEYARRRANKVRAYRQRSLAGLGEAEVESGGMWATLTKAVGDTYNGAIEAVSDVFATADGGAENVVLKAKEVVDEKITTTPLAKGTFNDAIDALKNVASVYTSYDLDKQQLSVNAEQAKRERVIEQSKQRAAEQALNQREIALRERQLDAEMQKRNGLAGKLLPLIPLAVGGGAVWLFTTKKKGG